MDPVPPGTTYMHMRMRMHHLLCVERSEGLDGLYEPLHHADVLGPEDGERHRLSGHQDDSRVGEGHQLLDQILLEDGAAADLESVAQVLK